MSPTVRRMVLFKHGVAYVERSGPAAGSFELSFAKAEMNDVLKSLAVWVAAGDARPSAVAFEKPESPEKALDDKGLNLPADRSLVGLLTVMRGRMATVRAAAEPVRGEIVGVETRADGDGWRSDLVLSTGGGSLRVLSLDAVTDVRLEDPIAGADLEFLLERRRAATSHERRTIHVGVDGTATDLRVAYVVPAPIWRVSYRVVRADDRTMITAWAIVHNPLDEDVRDVALTLTTGQPVSFDIDLYHPKTVRRVVVEETSRALTAPPSTFERAPVAGAARLSAKMAAAPAGPPRPAAARADEGMVAEAAAMAAAEGATLADRGELFEYRITQPITLRRGGSALVPMLSAPVRATKERIFREGALASPDLVLRFENSTGAVLEEGPATIYDDDVYAGEAMVPYSARGSEVRFAYAKDLSVRCQVRSTARSQAVSVRLGSGHAFEEHRHETTYALRADSDHEEPVDVIFELPKRQVEIDLSGALPFEETASFRRFWLTVPPRSFAQVEVVEVTKSSQSIQYRALTPAMLANWRKRDFLAEPYASRLGEVIGLWGEADLLKRKREGLETARAEVFRAQEQITKQLQVLKDGGAEGQLRLRYVGELGQQQDRVRALEAEIAQLASAADDAAARADSALAGLLS